MWQNSAQTLQELKRRRLELRKEGNALIDFFCEDKDTFKLDECFRIFQDFCMKFKKAVKVGFYGSGTLNPSIKMNVNVFISLSPRTTWNVSWRKLQDSGVCENWRKNALPGRVWIRAASSAGAAARTTWRCSPRNVSWTSSSRGPRALNAHWDAPPVPAAIVTQWTL